MDSALTADATNDAARADAALAHAIERIRAASAAGTPLRFRGGGTKDFHGQSFAGELLDTRALTGVTSYEPSELVVTVRAGTPLAQLEALLAERGQCLPFEPPHFAVGGNGSAAGHTSSATVGGMVASGLSGPARASVGSVRDYVLGATLVNGRGELLTFGGQVMKNVAGYDVSRLMAGSLGTLALIAEVSLKVLPVAPAEATLRFAMTQADALRALSTWGGQPLPLDASCWFAQGASTGAQADARGMLHLRLRGAAAAVRSACERLGGTVLAGGPHGAAGADGFDWQTLREQTHAFFRAPDASATTGASAQALWRLSVAPSAGPLPLDEPTLIEWHGGQRWLWAPLAEAPRIRAAAAAAGGHATVFRRPAGAEDGGVPVFTPPAPALARIHRELKARFDPTGIFNPGRLYAA